MKLWRRLGVALALSLSLSACAGTNVAPAGYINAADFRTCLLTLGKGGAGSINANAVTALNDGKKRLGVASRRTNVDSAAQIEKAIARDISVNCSLIIGVGEAFVEPLMEQAKYHRARHFALLLPPGTTAQASRENLAIITYDLSQPAYVAGFIAAGTSASGKVAVVAGEKNQINTTLISAFSQGVARYNLEQGQENRQSLKVKVIPGTDGFFLGAKANKARVKTQTKTVIEQGADVIFFAEGAQNSGGLEAIIKANTDKEMAAQAAEEASRHIEKPAEVESPSPAPSDSSPTPTASPEEVDSVESITAIWYLTDGHETQDNLPAGRPPVLTSIVPDLSQAMISLIEEARKDRFAANSTQIVGTYQNGWVGLTPFYEYGSTVPNEVKKNSQIIEEEFRQGTLKL
ncbi:BMP family ABC transporter substrate-binding protein [Varibaculum cambriense]|uniref:BMP family lipoprotein n=1 Tax=Varibaculum cambriense TaxID=184870 RepID=UPI00242CA9DF|nr:BMP family ABC transporter substrate-binding protein [Varibaculum cambriense]